MSDPILIEIPGKGIADLSAARLDKIARGYDSNLRFGYNPANQDYILYIAMPRNFDSFYVIDGEPVYPVIGFGKELPTEDQLRARIGAADVKKRGVDVYNQLMKYNAELRQKQEFAEADKVEEATERIEHLVRSLGLTEKYGKVVMHVPKTRKR